MKPCATLIKFKLTEKISKVKIKEIVVLVCRAGQLYNILDSCSCKRVWLLASLRNNFHRRPSSALTRAANTTLTHTLRIAQPGYVGPWQKF